MSRLEKIERDNRSMQSHYIRDLIKTVRELLHARNLDARQLKNQNKEIGRLLGENDDSLRECLLLREENQRLQKQLDEALQNRVLQVIELPQEES